MQDFNNTTMHGDEFEVSVAKQDIRKDGPVYNQFYDGDPDDVVTNGSAAKDMSQMSKSEKKLAAAKKKKKKRRGTAGLVVLEVLCFMVFGTAVWIMGTGRVEAADALVGSTVLPEVITEAIPNETPSIDVVRPDDSNKGEHNYVAEGYRYIVPAELDKKTPTALAAWYLIEFDQDDGDPINTEALSEYNIWYAQKISTDATFKENYEQAITYLEEHPELLEVEKDKTVEEEEKENKK